MNDDDTIVAPATPTGRGAIGIIRLSGEAAWDIVSPYIAIKDRESRKIYKSTFPLKGGGILDEIAFILYRSPSSYTGEDMVELFFHGGMVIVATALDELIRGGARMAEPGEFTRRAFLNGKIDLVTAESIERLIDAPSKASLTATTRLMGLIKQNVNYHIISLERLRTEIIASIEFPEDVDIDIDLAPLEEAVSALKEISQKAEKASPMDDIPMVVLTGKPNSGKSSIFNRILREERAIVHHEAGTTRDFIEATFVHNSIAMKIIDTAGIDNPKNHIDKIAMARASALLEDAAVTVWIQDSTLQCLEDPVPSFVNVVNKVDLSGCDHSDRFILVSAKKGTGIERLLDVICENLIPIENDYLNMSQRARDRIKNSISSLERSLAAFSEETLDIGLIELERGLEGLYLLTGKEYSRDILDDVFKNFCIGK